MRLSLTPARGIDLKQGKRVFKRYNEFSRASRYRDVQSSVVEWSKCHMHQTKSGLLFASSGALDTGDPI